MVVFKGYRSQSADCLCSTICRVAHIPRAEGSPVPATWHLQIQQTDPEELQRLYCEAE